MSLTDSLQNTLFCCIIFWCSDCWRGCKLCRLCICSSNSCYSSWCIKHYCKVISYIGYCFLFFFFIPWLSVLWIVCLSAVLAHFMLKEKLHQLGVLGCVMCISGSVIIVIHAPQESPITSVQEIWTMATEPGWLSPSTIFLCCLFFVLNHLIMLFPFHYSIFTLSGLSYCIGRPFDLIFCTKMWAYKCVGFHRHLLINGISLGTLFQLLIVSNFFFFRQED